jgi:hypothetical protein
VPLICKSLTRSHAHRRLVASPHGSRPHEKGGIAGLILARVALQFERNREVGRPFALDEYCRERARLGRDLEAELDAGLVRCDFRERPFQLVADSLDDPPLPANPRKARTKSPALPANPRLIPLISEPP